MFTVIVDAHSKWPEVVPMSTTTTEKNIGSIEKHVFQVWSTGTTGDGYYGPQFTSSEFESCMKGNGIKHIHTSPYHPASNGEAERFVQTFKHLMKANKNDPGT